MLMPFGKYRGFDSADLPSDYLMDLWLKDWVYEFYPHMFEELTETLLVRDLEKSHFYGRLSWQRDYQREH